MWVRGDRRRRARSERGATVVEAAIAFPVFMLIVLALIEFGFFMAASSGTTSAARDGARFGSAAMAPAGSKDVVADEIRDRVTVDLRTLNKNDAPVRLWVYKAAADGSPCVNIACASGTGFASCPDAVCYRYTGWDDSARVFTNRAGSWTVTDACAPAIDAIGVHVRVTHSYLSKVLGSSTTLDEKSVLRLEPLPTLQCAGP